jgi:hypothetical protein
MSQYNTCSTRFLFLLPLTLALAVPALAGDAIKASVEPISPSPVVTVNGSGYTPGTYAIGTIQLFYTVVDTHFTPGTFATFTLKLEDTTNYKSGQNTSYPVTLNLDQTGSKNLLLLPAQPSFRVTDATWSGSTVVTIAIPPDVPDADGTELVGNLQLETDPPGSHLDTVTTVQVHVRLVHPAGACLRTYDFITDENLAALAAPLAVNVKNGEIKSTNPGQLSDNVFVVNACSEPESFDLRILLDAAFKTNPSSNPGNAVFTYVTVGTTAPLVSTVASFKAGTETKYGQALCLPAITLEPNQTLLATVHMALNKAVAPCALPTGPSQFSFSAEVRLPGTTCGADALSSLATSNPVEATLTYDLK